MPERSIIATQVDRWCLEMDHSVRDFLGAARHRGLRTWPKRLLLVSCCIAEGEITALDFRAGRELHQPLILQMRNEPARESRYSL